MNPAHWPNRSRRSRTYRHWTTTDEACHRRHQRVRPTMIADGLGDYDGLDRSPQHRDQSHGGSDSPVNASVVVGIDGSDTSWDALCWACGETIRLGGRTIAVFVGPNPGAASATASASLTGTSVPYQDLQQSTTDEAEKLSAQVRTYGHDHGVDVAFVHTQGDTAK